MCPSAQRSAFTEWKTSRAAQPTARNHRSWPLAGTVRWGMVGGAGRGVAGRGGAWRGGATWRSVVMCHRTPEPTHGAAPQRLSAHPSQTNVSHGCTTRRGRGTPTPTCSSSLTRRQAGAGVHAALMQLTLPTCRSIIIGSILYRGSRHMTGQPAAAAAAAAAASLLPACWAGLA